jgi:hypothetical protein
VCDSRQPDDGAGSEPATRPFDVTVTFRWHDSDAASAEMGVRLELDLAGVLGAGYTVKVEEVR